MTNHPDDPVIAELRAIREAHAARFNHDMGEIFRDIRAMQEESGREFIRLPPCPIVDFNTQLESKKSDS